MNWAKIPYQQSKLTRAKNIFLLALIAFVSSSTYTKAQGVKSTSPVVRFVPPPPPSTQVITSGRQRGGASRGDCPAVNKPLSAIVPATWHEVKKPGKSLSLTSWESVWGLTSLPHPTFWFYIPYAFTPKLPIEFVIQSEQGNNIYKTSLSTPQKQPSFVQVQMPSKAVPLEVGKTYHWFLVVNCTLDAPPVVEGWIQRVANRPALTSQLDKANLQERFALYAENGIWYDALNTLAQMRRNNPNDRSLLLNWVNFLNSIGLKAIAYEPIR